MKVCLENNGVCMVAENELENNLLKERASDLYEVFLKLVEEQEKKSAKRKK